MPRPAPPWGRLYRAVAVRRRPEPVQASRGGPRERAAPLCVDSPSKLGGSFLAAPRRAPAPCLWPSKLGGSFLAASRRAPAPGRSDSGPLVPRGRLAARLGARPLGGRRSSGPVVGARASPWRGYCTCVVGPPSSAARSSPPRVGHPRHVYGPPSSAARSSPPRVGHPRQAGLLGASSVGPSQPGVGRASSGALVPRAPSSARGLRPGAGTAPRAARRQWPAWVASGRAPSSARGLRPGAGTAPRAGRRRWRAWVPSSRAPSSPRAFGWRGHCTSPTRLGGGLGFLGSGAAGRFLLSTGVVGLLGGDRGPVGNRGVTGGAQTSPVRNSTGRGGQHGADGIPLSSAQRRVGAGRRTRVAAYY